MAKLDHGQWPLAEDDRYALAMFMGTQVVRTPEQQFMFQEMADVELKSRLAEISRDDVRRILAKDGLDASEEAVDEHLEAVRATDEYTLSPGQGYTWSVLLGDVAPRLARVMAEAFDWHLMTSDRRLLATSDNPVLPWSSRRQLGVGVANAEVIMFPLDSKRLLFLTLGRMGVSPTFPLARSFAKGVNGYLTQHAMEWMFHDPRIKPINQEELGSGRRPALTIGDQEVHELGDAWKILNGYISTLSE